MKSAGSSEDDIDVWAEIDYAFLGPPREIHMWIDSLGKASEMVRLTASEARALGTRLIEHADQFELRAALPSAKEVQMSEPIVSIQLFPVSNRELWAAVGATKVVLAYKKRRYRLEAEPWLKRLADIESLRKYRYVIMPSQEPGLPPEVE